MPAWSRRRGVLSVAAAAALALVVRRVAVGQLAALTGRAVALRDVELNLFTGRVALNRFRLAQRDSTEPALEIERLDVRVAPLSLLSRENVRVVELTVMRPKIYVTRLAADRYDFSDLLALIPPPDPNKKPSTRTVLLERLRVVGGGVFARDLVPQPAGLWRIERLDVDATRLSTRQGARPGRLTVRAVVNDTPLALDASAVALAEGRLAARITVEGFDLAAARAYLPPDLPAAPTAGRVTLDLTATAERAADGTPSVALSGDARVHGLAVLPRAH